MGGSALGFMILSGTVVADAATPTVTTYAIPTSFSNPYGITAGSDGALWFAEGNDNKIGRVSTSGTITEYPIPTGGGYSQGITSGPDGALWFTEANGNKIGRITTSGTITEYPVGTVGPTGITAGSDGALWFTEYAAGRVGRITTSGVITNYLVPNGGQRNANPQDITTGPDGALWFTNYSSSTIGRITTPAPGAPAGLTASTPTQNPALSWGGVAGATSYNVYRNGVNIGSSTSASYTDNSAPQGTDSYYVTAVASGAESAASNTISVLVDRTPPTISYSVSPGPDGSGWNNTPVTVTFTCGDASSGVASCPSPVTLSGNGSGQTVSGTATDNAGNTASVTTAAININNVPPTVAAPSVTNTSNPGNNIVTGDTVTVSAGVGGSDPSGIVAAEFFFGADPGTGHGTPATLQSGNVLVVINGGLASGTYSCNVRVEDGAGNWSAPQPVTIVVYPPAPGMQPQAAYVQTPLLQWTAVANAGSYEIFRDGVQIDTVAGNVTTYLDSAAPEGSRTYYVETVDATSGLVSSASNVVTVIVDRTPPVITYTQSPAANANGWNNSDVTVTFHCSDALSGVTCCTPPVTVSGETAGTDVTGCATDGAGNHATVTDTVKIDETAPTISYALSQVPNANGWNNADVVVTFTCSDALSGIAVCPGPITVGEGANQTVTGVATDNAGNSSSVVITLSVDKTNPTIAAAVSSAPNAAGWNNAPVTVTFACMDGLSGVQSCSAPVTLNTDGPNQVVTGTAVDNADNTSSVSVTLNIDQTAPTITYTLSSSANSAGWYNVPVTVTFHCSDALSGVANCPVPIILSSDGTNQSVSGTVTDVAGNTTSVTASGINIDSALPTISYILSQTPNANGWFNAPVTVTFTCGDAISGVANCPSPITVSGDTAGQVVSGTATDNAGNMASTSMVVKLNQMPPTISYSLSGTPNSAGWYNQDVTVTFTCSDDLSGIASCPSPVTVGEGANQTVSGTAVDQAGNSASVLVVLNVDEANLIITFSATPAANAAGWNNAPVTITFTCADALSGVAICSSPVTLGEGANQTSMGTVTDVAGNTASVTTGAINIDLTPPVITYSLSSQPDSYGWYDGPVTVTFHCSDALSGVASCLDPITLSADGANQFISGTVTDVAGNTASVATAGINIDTTAPTFMALIMSGLHNSPHFGLTLSGATTNLSCNVADTLSGVVSAIYYLDGSPTQTTGTAMTLSGNTATATDNLKGLSPGQHTLYVRVRDAAGNWSTADTITFLYR